MQRCDTPVRALSANNAKSIFCLRECTYLYNAVMYFFTCIFCLAFAFSKLKMHSHGVSMVECVTKLQM